MIQPIIIRFEDYQKTLLENTGELFIYCKGEYICLTESYDQFQDNSLSFYRKSNLLWLKRINDTKFLIFHDDVSKEEFFEHLQKNYPNHYEWFIWNLP